MDNTYFKELAEKMAAQDNRSTQYPLFYICEKQECWVNEDNYDKILWFDDSQGERTENYTDKEGNEWKWDVKKSIWTCESLDKEYDAFDFELEVTDTLRIIYVKEVDIPVVNVGPFLTEEAAQKHIDANHYHYNKPFIYVNSAWRNYEMQEVMHKIFELAEMEIPIQYK